MHEKMHKLKKLLNTPSEIQCGINRKEEQILLNLDSKDVEVKKRDKDIR